jgi:hypothetical protein
MPQYFTRDEAEMVLSKVQRLMSQALTLKAEFEQAKAVLDNTTREIMTRGGMAIDTGSLLQTRQTRDSAATELGAILERIQEHGCLVKDLDAGLLDFPTLYAGREVYLCWKFGEPRIEFWHGVDEGFRGRKVIDDEFLSNHAGDPLS